MVNFGSVLQRHILYYYIIHFQQRLWSQNVVLGGAAPGKLGNGSSNLQNNRIGKGRRHTCMELVGHSRNGVIDGA